MNDPVKNLIAAVDKAIAALTCDNDQQRQEAIERLIAARAACGDATLVWTQQQPVYSEQQVQEMLEVSAGWIYKQRQAGLWLAGYVCGTKRFYTAEHIRRNLERVSNSPQLKEAA